MAWVNGLVHMVMPKRNEDGPPWYHRCTHFCPWLRNRGDCTAFGSNMATVVQIASEKVPSSSTDLSQWNVSGLFLVLVLGKPGKHLIHLLGGSQSHC